jgi:hypothetical protein
VHLELVDVLRCPRQHAPSLLIATIDGMGGRSVERGALGCPVCDARYAIVDGAVVFDSRRYIERRAAKAMGSAHPDRVERAAALLGLVDPGGLVLLGGAASNLAASLHEIADVFVILYNPPGPAAGWDAVTPIYADHVPLAPGVLRGAVLDDDGVGRIDEAVRALRSGGRLVAPASAPVPDGVRELARDADVWVAERGAEVAIDPVPLRRAGRAHPSS